MIFLTGAILFYVLVCGLSSSLGKVLVIGILMHFYCLYFNFLHGYGYFRRHW